MAQNMQRAMACGQNLRRKLPEPADNTPAQNRPEHGMQTGAAHRLFDKTHQPHQANARKCTGHTQQHGQRVVQTCDIAHINGHNKGRMVQGLRHNIAHEGRNRHRCQRRDCVNADHQFKGIGRASQRRIKGRGYGAGHAAPHHCAQFRAA